MQDITLSKETIGRIEFDAEQIPEQLGWPNEDGIAEPTDIKRAYIKGATAEATKNIRVANALETLINALTHENIDREIWNGEVGEAIQECNAALLEQAQPIPEETPHRMPAQFIPASINPEKEDTYYCIVKVIPMRASSLPRFDRYVIGWCDGIWEGLGSHQEVTEWLCKDADFIEKVNMGQI